MNGQLPELPPALRALLGDFPELKADPFARFVNEILKWNPQVGVVSKRTTIPSVARLVRQSIDLARVAGIMGPDGVKPRVVDLGSGGGFPGLIWKLVQPGIEMTLVERKEKKASFLKRAALIAGVDLDIFAGDAETICNIDRYRQHFEIATAMAVGPPAEVGRLVEPLLGDGGLFCTCRPFGEETFPERIGTRLELSLVRDGHECKIAAYSIRNR